MGRSKKETHEEWLERNKRREEGLRGRDKARIKEYKERKQYTERFGINPDFPNLRNSSSKSRKQNKNRSLPKSKKVKRGFTVTQADLKKSREARLSKSNTANTEIIERVNWTLLPVGTDWSSFESHFNKQVIKSGSKLDPNKVEVARERFKRIYELEPKSVYRGFETFSDYFALLFEDTDKVVLESVNYGNAIYIIEGDWKILSRRTKAELKTSIKTKVIHHRSDWFSKLKNYLQIGFK